MKRFFEDVLMRWHGQSCRKPLVIRGMRQTGKTWCVRNFAEKVYGSNFLEVNFEFSDEWKSVFERDLDPKRICSELELLSEKPLLSGDTLIFLDEVQLCPRALASLRYFYEKLPSIPVVAAGSLLDFVLADIQFPVGRVQFAELQPMTFGEYLDAIGKTSLSRLLREPPRKLPDAVHGKLLEEVRRYSITGGLPECVKTWCSTESLLETRSVMRDLVAAFEQDFSKYSAKASPSILRDVWRGAVAAAGRQVSYASLSREHTGATNKTALELLARARLVRISRAASAAALPFDLDVTPRIKPFSGDIGLYQFLSGRPVDESIREADFLGIYNGALAEQFVAQELAASFGGDEPHWWKREAKNAQAEIDFMVALGGKVQPIEVKSGAAGRLKSLHQLVKDHPTVNDAIVFSSAPFGELPAQRIRFLPIYYAGSVSSLRYGHAGTSAHDAGM